MHLKPLVRRFGLFAHIVTSVGWLGAVIVFAALSVAGLTAEDPQLVRASYRLMDMCARNTLVPLAFASLLTGIAQSLLTHWGLFQHYWVVMKLVATAGATTILLVYLETFRTIAAMAADPATAIDAVRNPSPLLHAALALLVLGFATALAIFKPRGLTALGWRRRSAGSTGPS